MLNALRVLFLPLLFISCTKEVDYQTLTIAFSTDIRGFDPAFATDIRTGKVISLVYDNLVRFDEEMNLIPSIAKDWNISKDGKTYTFYIRNNVLFHDGSSLKIDDIIYSYQRVLAYETASPQSWLFDRIKGADNFAAGETDHVAGLRIINDSTLVISLSEPFAPFIQYLAMPSAAIINKNHVSTITSIPAGSGPWKLVRWERDGEIQLGRNINYWEPPPKTGNLKIRILSEVMTQAAEFEAGLLDLLELSPSEIEYWKNKDIPENNWHTFDELNIWYLGMNCSRPPFNDIRLRQAMNYALDREKIVHLLLNDTAEPANGPVPPSLLYKKSEPFYEYNPQKAIRLLKEAGFDNGIQTELWVAGGSVMYHLLEAIQSDLSAVGIDVSIKRSDWNVFKTAVREGKPDLYYLDWYADYPDGENFLYPLFHSSESMIKRNRFSDPEVDSLIEQIQKRPISRTRQLLIDHANEIIADKAPWVFLWHSKTNIVQQPWISGFTPSPLFNAQRYTNVEKGINR